MVEKAKKMYLVIDRQCKVWRYESKLKYWEVKQKLKEEGIMILKKIKLNK